MNAKWRMLVVQLTRRLWFRSALYGLAGVLTALLGAVARRWIPDDIASQIGVSAVGNILGILASSMLAVTTFSLSTMVASYTAASSNATPRVATLLIENASAQSALASFIGVFLFSIVGLIALSTGIYGNSGRLVLFVATIVMIIMVVVTLLRWIDQLSRLGRVTETIDRVEKAARDAMRKMAQKPRFGAAPYQSPPTDAIPFESRDIGYIAYIDVARLQDLAEKEEMRVWVEVTAGSFVAPGRPIARFNRTVDEDLAKRIDSAFVINDTRNFDQDPRFGLVVLTEIAVRALSPAINDPGTAIDVLGTATRLLCRWAQARQEAEPEEVEYDRVFVPELDDREYFEDVFSPLGRDSASLLEVAIRLQKSLATLGQLGYPPYREAAAQQAERALKFIAKSNTLESDQRMLQGIASWRSANG